MAELNANYNPATGQVKGNIDLEGITSSAEVEIPDGLTSAQNNEKENPQLKQLSESLDGIFKDLSDQLLEMMDLKEKDDPKNEFINSMKDEFFSLFSDDDEDSILGFTDPNQTDKNALKDIPAIHGLGFALVLNKLDEILGFMTTTWGEKKEDGGGKSGGGLGGLFKSLGGMGGLMQAAMALLVFAGALAIAETFGISEKSLFLLALFTTFVVGFALLGKLVKKEEQTFKDMATGTLIMSAALVVFTGAIYFAGFVGKQLIENGLIGSALAILGMFVLFVAATVVAGNFVKSSIPSILALGIGALILSVSLIVFAEGIKRVGEAAFYIQENDLIWGVVGILLTFVILVGAVVAVSTLLTGVIPGIILFGVGTMLLSASLMLFAYSLKKSAQTFSEVDFPYMIGILVTMGVIFGLAAVVGTALIVGAIGIAMIGVAALSLSIGMTAFALATRAVMLIDPVGLLLMVGVLALIAVISIALTFLIAPITIGTVAAALLVPFSVLLLLSMLTLSGVINIASKLISPSSILKATLNVGLLVVFIIAITASFAIMLAPMIAAGVISALLIPLALLMSAGLLFTVLTINGIAHGLVLANDNLKKLEENGSVSEISSYMAGVISDIASAFGGLVGFGFLKNLSAAVLVASAASSIESIFNSFNNFFTNVLKLDLSDENISAVEKMTNLMVAALGDIIVSLAEASKDMDKESRKSMKVIGETITPIMDSITTLVSLIDYFSDSDNILSEKERESVRINILGLADIIKKDILGGLEGIFISGFFPSEKSWEKLSASVNSLSDISDLLKNISFDENSSNSLEFLFDSLISVGKNKKEMKDARKSFDYVGDIFDSLSKYNLDSLTSLDAALKEIDLAKSINNVSINAQNLGPAMNDLKVAIESFNNIEDAGIVHFGKILLAISDDLTTGNISHLAMAMHSLVQSVNQVDIKSATAIGDMALKLLGNPMAAASIQATGATLITENSASEDPSLAIYRILKKWDSKGFPEGNPGLNSSSSASSKKAAVEEKGGFKWPWEK